MREGVEPHPGSQGSGTAPSTGEFFQDNVAGLRTLWEVLPQLRQGPPHLASFQECRAGPADIQSVSAENMGSRRATLRVSF